jgi:hypothetical protein
VKEKDKPKADYNAVIEKGETAGLLELLTPDVFRTSMEIDARHFDFRSSVGL